MKVHLFGAASGIGNWVARHLLVPEQHRLFGDVPWREAVLWDTASLKQLEQALPPAEQLPVSLAQVPGQNEALPADKFDDGDLLLLAVPENALPSLARQLQPAIKPDTTALSLTSVQQGALATLGKELAKARIGGLHLLFGPATEAPQNQNAVLVNCDSKPAAHVITTLEEFLRAQGMNISHSDAKQHDEAMAYIQTMTHFILLAFAEMLTTADKDTDKDIDWHQLATPPFRTLLGLTEGMLRQAPETLASIQSGAFRTEHRGRALEAMRELHDRLVESEKGQGAEGLAASIKDITAEFKALARDEN